MNERLYGGWTLEEVERKNFMCSEVGEAVIARIRELDDAIRKIEKMSNINPDKISVNMIYGSMKAMGEIARKALGGDNA